MENTEYFEESFGDITLYHGSNKLCETIKPIGLDLGNKFQPPGWSAFYFKNKKFAYNWAIYQTIKNNIFRTYFLDNPNMYLPQVEHNTIRIVIEKETYDAIISKVREKEYTGYLYTVEVPLKKVSIGNTSSLKEYTVRIELSPMKTERLQITPDILESISLPISARRFDEYRNELFNSRKILFNRNLIESLFNTNEFMVNQKLVQMLYRDIKLGKLLPGDDLDDYIAKNKYNCTYLSPIDRIRLYMNNTDVRNYKKI